MSKSSGLGRFGRPMSGSVTVIATHVEKKNARNAKVGFWAALLSVTLLSASILTASRHPVLALMAGGLLGFTCGSMVWAVVRVWPALRFIWWWLPEIGLVSALLYGFTSLSGLIGNVYVLAAVTLLLAGVPALIPAVRRLVIALGWCLVVRHRLRMVFTDVIKTNRHGSLPLIGPAVPTAVGERVWIVLRPGLSKTELVNRLEVIAAACHATTVVIEQPGSNAAFLRVDVKRRDALTAVISSPLVDKLGRDSNTKANGNRAPSGSSSSAGLLLPPMAGGLNLDDVPLITRYVPSAARNGSAASAKSAPAAANPNGEAVTGDDNEWI